MLLCNIGMDGRSKDTMFGRVDVLYTIYYTSLYDNFFTLLMWFPRPRVPGRSSCVPSSGRVPGVGHPCLRLHANLGH